MNNISRKRIIFLDEWRGLVIILMIFYHAVYSFAYIFGADIPFAEKPFMDYMQLFISWSFIFVSGIMANYSSGNLTRGFRLLLIAGAITLITYFFFYEQRILFGVLHFLGFANIIYAVLKPAGIWRLPPGLGILISLFLYYLTYPISDGFLQLWGSKINLPDFLYGVPYLFPLGFIGDKFFSSDYFPIVPYFFLFAAGVYFGVCIKIAALPRFFYRRHIPALSFLGRHSLLIYVLHQPLIVGIGYLIFRVR